MKGEGLGDRKISLWERKAEKKKGGWKKSPGRIINN